MDPYERWLAYLLRFGGIVTGAAFFTIFLPQAWMASTHRGLGLGEFPAVPITDYLTRSLSAMYAFHGGFLLVLSTNVRRFRPIVVYVGWATFAFGVLQTAIDVNAGLPRWWILGEGPWLLVIGPVIVWLSARVKPFEEALD